VKVLTMGVRSGDILKYLRHLHKNGHHRCFRSESTSGTGSANVSVNAKSDYTLLELDEYYKCNFPAAPDDCSWRLLENLAIASAPLLLLTPFVLGLHPYSHSALTQISDSLKRKC